MNDVYLLLGSNIDPNKNIRLAIKSLTESKLLSILRISSIWQTKAVGSNASDYLNVAVYVQTTCELSCLKSLVIGEIEKKLARVRTEDKFAPRTIDLDVIVFNQQIIENDVFRLDHIMLPMAELYPGLYSPELKRTLFELSKEREKHTQAIRL